MATIEPDVEYDGDAAVPLDDEGRLWLHRTHISDNQITFAVRCPRCRDWILKVKSRWVPSIPPVRPRTHPPPHGLRDLKRLYWDERDQRAAERAEWKQRRKQYKQDRKRLREAKKRGEPLPRRVPVLCGCQGSHKRPDGAYLSGCGNGFVAEPAWPPPTYEEIQQRGDG